MQGMQKRWIVSGGHTRNSSDHSWQQFLHVACMCLHCSALKQQNLWQWTGSVWGDQFPATDSSWGISLSQHQHKLLSKTFPGSQLWTVMVDVGSSCDCLRNLGVIPVHSPHEDTLPSIPVAAEFWARWFVWKGRISATKRLRHIDKRRAN